MHRFSQINRKGWFFVTNEFYFTSYDGASQLFAKEWSADENPCAILLLVHDQSDRIDRYDRFAEDLSACGIVVAGADLPGHGRSVSSSDDLGYFGDGKDMWSVIVEDIHILRLLLQNKYPSTPVFVMGCGMGSFLVRSYISQHCENLAGAILCGTGNLSVPFVMAGLGIVAVDEKKFGPRHVSNRLHSMFFTSYNRRLSDARTDFDWLSRDEAEVDKYMADESCGFPLTVSAYKTLFNGLLSSTSKKALAGVSPVLPIFLISGACDPIGDNGRGVVKVSHAFQDSGLRKVTVKIYVGCRHDLLHDMNYQQVHSDIMTWIENRL